MAGRTRRTGSLPAAGAAAAMALIALQGALRRRRARRRATSRAAVALPAGAGTANTRTAAAADTRIIGILSDSHAHGKHSWWRQTVVADTVPGLRLGSYESHPGAQTTGLVDRLDAAVRQADLVVVQAGTNDIRKGRSPEQAAEGVRVLWDGIAARGAAPVAALVPPSETQPALAVELNRLIRTAAEARGIPLLDVYTAVAAADGSWRAGLSNDGIHSNRKGSDLLAEAARGQLAGLTN
ncbi:SGNH/GDSL hydrolase family protein [uncultured Arthrobacter sp.]|uniref:SGNH/GDSL hydrolase family protein n=1 Tax=uncultured Arthrobacter sp. TaxID=114050 RepID=UPI0025E351B1|nr:SGNH/GDSL hydrolase family protein [uncultured Arthrobacter sp.]